jgi:hypothetical protein
MAKRRRVTTQRTIERRIKEKRGQGYFSEYKPWLTIHDVPSKGIVTRILGWKSGRLHHFFSEHYELAHFYQMEWAPSVIDIREQYPLLPLEKTLYIAQMLGVKHPTDPRTHQPVVMTTDMLLTLKKGEEISFWAHSIKPASQLNKRVLEKLEIERRFWEDQGIKWSLITEQQINYKLVKNIEWLHSAKSLEGLSNVTKDLLMKLEPKIFEALQTVNNPCAVVANELDILFEFPPGTIMYTIKHLIANCVWLVDMTKLIQPTLEPLVILCRNVKE